MTFEPYKAFAEIPGNTLKTTKKPLIATFESENASTLSEEAGSVHSSLPAQSGSMQWKAQLFEELTLTSILGYGTLSHT